MLSVGLKGVSSSPCYKSVIRRHIVGSQSVKMKLGGQCENAASLAVSQFLAEIIA